MTCLWWSVKVIKILLAAGASLKGYVSDDDEDEEDEEDDDEEDEVEDPELNHMTPRQLAELHDNKECLKVIEVRERVA